MRAFEGMVSSGVGYESAFEVAVRVFLHHHPEAGSGSRALVQRWVASESLH